MWGSFYSQLTVLSALYLYPLLCHLSVVAKYLQFQSGHSVSRHTTLLHHPAQPHLNADISRDFVDVATTVYCLCLLYYHNMVAFHSHQLTPCYHTTCLPILLLAPSSLTPQVHTSPAFFPIHAFIFIS